MDRKEDNLITYEDTWYKVDTETGEKTEIEKPQERRSSSHVDDFLENFLKNKLITFGRNNDLKKMQEEWIMYITEQHAFEEKSIDDLKGSLSNDDNELIKNHQQFFKILPYLDYVGLLRGIGLDYLTQLKDHLNQFKNQTGGKKRKKSKHRKRRKSRTKRRKKKTKKRRKSRRKKRYKFKRKSRR